MAPEHIIYGIIESPIGEIIIGTVSDACCLFEFHDRGGIDRIKARMLKRCKREMQEGKNDVLQEVERQAMEYFSGTRRSFDLPIVQQGTAFELSVWRTLMNIPYGQTRTYGDIASELGKPGASRAVGRANGANLIPIIVPCHRVIDANGDLHGYGGGLWRKRWLLEDEGAMTRQMVGGSQSAHSISILSNTSSKRSINTSSPFACRGEKE